MKWLIMHDIRAWYMHQLFLFLIITFSGRVITASLTFKLKLCVEYQVDSSRVTDGILTVIHNITRSKCIIECARHPICRAFNIWHAQGTCELLPDFGDCGEGSHQEGSTFIQLRPCKASVPWSVEWRNLSVDDATCLKWTLHDGTLSCPTNGFSSPKGNSCLGLTPHKGLYLPSWQAPSLGFRIVTVDEQTVRCRRGYLLETSPDCPVSWIPFRLGDPIPTKAVEVSTWTNGSPLYFVFAIRYYGYYLPYTGQSYIMAARVLNPTELLILVYNWHMKTNGLI